MSKSRLKTYRTLRAAKAEANGLPIIRVGWGSSPVYIVGFDDLTDCKLCEIAVIAPSGDITGFVGAGHLDRLGNANWAVPGPDEAKRRSAITAFPKEQAAA